MDHILDRPAWSALTTRQASLALGDARALRFAPDYGLFAGAADDGAESLDALYALIPPDGAVAIVEAAPVALPPLAKVIQRSVVNQMTATEIAPGDPAFSFEPLTDADGPQMLALATRTKPGPFFGRTHQLGDFIGVKQDGVLVAMAGERMKPDGHTEVSGVCTHPDHRGRGYAGALMRIVARRILERGETAFLHVYADNTGAIALYEALGFRLRRSLTMTVLTRG